MKFILLDVTHTPRPLLSLQPQTPGSLSCCPSQLSSPQLPSHTQGCPHLFAWPTPAGPSAACPSSSTTKPSLGLSHPHPTPRHPGLMESHPAHCTCPSSLHSIQLQTPQGLRQYLSPLSFYFHRQALSSAHRRPATNSRVLIGKWGPLPFTRPAP